MMQATAAKAGRFNYILGLVTFVALFGIVWVLWYIFMNPNTVFKLYTPMYGFALVVYFLASILLITNVAEYYPFSEKALEEGSLAKGGVLTILAILLMLFLFYVVFWGFIGKFGVAYFSPQSIIAGGGIGAEFFVARENACTAMIYYFAAFIWMAIFWKSGFDRWPWQDLTRAVAAWSRFFAIFFMVNIIYVVLFHPHVCYLFYPAQTKAGVAPWWGDWAHTTSAFFSLGIVICIIFWLTAFDLLWEGMPFKKLEKDSESTFLKGIVVFVVSVILGLILVYILTRCMNYFWDEAFMGGQYTDGPDFRYIHTGEISGFFILAAFVLHNYFNNFPNFGNIWLRAIIRTLITIAGGIMFYAFYYSPLATIVLAKVPGVAQPGDTPLVWTFLFVSMIMLHTKFFRTWPLKKGI
jgi:AAT family amino acid transporter